MKEYYFNFADLNVKMETEESISIADNLQSFMLETGCENTDCNIKVVPCEELTPDVKKAYTKDMTQYILCEDEYRMYHYSLKSKEPFALTIISEDGKIDLQYLKEFKHYFIDSTAIFNRIGFEALLLQNHRILLHSSFIKYDNKAILFSAPSGTGKSTQAELWKTHKQADILNGDRAAIGMNYGEWTAWGIPYAGTSGIYKNEKAPIGAIVVLKQAKENRVQRLRGIEAFRFLYPEISVHHWNPAYVEKVSDLLQKLLADIPVYLLECLPDEGAVELLYHTLKEEGNL